MAQNDCENCKRFYPPLPEGWRIKAGMLIDCDQYGRSVTNQSGAIDRDSVSTILSNYGYGYLARRWVMSPAEANAKELREKLSDMVRAFNDYDARFRNMELLDSAIKLLAETAD